jgi:hypothetical protein
MSPLNGYASARLAELLADHGRADELHRLADSDNQAAAAQLARLLAERGDLDALQDRANAGDAWAAERLATLLGQQDGGDHGAHMEFPCGRLSSLEVGPFPGQCSQVSAFHPSRTRRFGKPLLCPAHAEALW